MTSLLSGGVAIALINILLTLALVRRMLQLYTPWLLASYAVYAFLLFAHPHFYIEHRHDLPAAISWFFLALSLLAWTSWVRTRRVAMLACAVLAAVLFAFAKETYFISALILVLGMAVVNPSARRRHLAFLAFLVAIEFVSFAWTSHFNGPFVNVNADANATYHISLAPASLAQTYWFYLSQLVNPFFIAIAGLGLAASWPDRRRFIQATVWVVAGLVVFATLAVLPNHKFEEYAWAAAPLFLAPVLTLCKSACSFRWKAAQIGMAAGLFILTVAGPGGYYERCKADGFRWWVDQDRRSAAVWSSFGRLEAIPRPARVLVSGLEDPMLPWQVGEFVQRQFGDRIQWTIVLPSDVLYRRNSRLVSFVNAADVRLSNIDYRADYYADGRLANIVAVKHDFAAVQTSAPVSRAEFHAEPAQIVQPDHSGLGITELVWNAQAGTAVEIHVNSPSGPLFTRGGSSGRAVTPKWVKNGMEFFLQDVTDAKRLTPENTLAIVQVEVTP